MAGISRRQLEQLKELLGEACEGHFVIGMPGLFAVAYRPRTAEDPPGAGHSVKLDDEVLESTRACVPSAAGIGGPTR